MLNTFLATKKLILLYYIHYKRKGREKKKEGESEEVGVDERRKEDRLIRERLSARVV